MDKGIKSAPGIKARSVNPAKMLSSSGKLQTLLHGAAAID